MEKLLSSKILVIITSIFFVVLPFFWLHPGQMDLGGDSSRLYFYEPLSYLKNFGLFAVFPQGIGEVSPNFFIIPYVLLLYGLKYIFHSSYIVISLINSLKLAGGFLAMYLLISEFLKVKGGQYAAIVASIFYVCMSTMTGNWDKAIFSHNQVFLNPLMAFFIVKFFLTNQFKYIIFFLLISLFFSPNFGLTSAPAIFSFYPLVITFLAIYAFFLSKKIVSIKKILSGGILFFGLHAFHLLPQLVSIFDSGSFANTRIFDKANIVQEGVRYFIAILPISKVSEKILLSSNGMFSIIISFIFLFIILITFIKRNNKALLLTGIFFLLTLFLLTAKITNVATIFYQSLFYIPGFSMFRNFIGQWLFVFSFFYALLIGQSLAFIFEKLRKNLIIVLTIIIGVSIIISASDFIGGKITNHKIWEKPERRIVLNMDQNFENALHFIEALPDDNKFLTLPFTDAFYQVVPGKNDGLYIGSSMISFIAGKKDFGGYQVISPFSDFFLSIVKEKDYATIRTLFNILDIHYVFHNSNPAIYDHIIPDVPYQYVRQFFPANQKEYKEFIANLGGEEIYTKGPYQIYRLNDGVSHFYIAKSVIIYPQKQTEKYLFLKSHTNEYNPVFIDSITCKTNKICNSTNDEKIEMRVKKINPTLYKITFQNSNNPFLLVFSEAYHKDWKIYSNSIEDSFDLFGFKEIFSNVLKKDLFSKSHIEVNGYSNGWYINPQQIGNTDQFTVYVEMTQQRIFYVSSIISIFTLCCILAIIITAIFRRKNVAGIIGK